MPSPTLLRARMSGIAEFISRTHEALGLLGLGSVGVEQHRLDVWSDLDFYVIARPGLKSRFVERLDWLDAVSPIGYSFKNTRDGYKVLFADGVYAEFAVFEPEELTSVPYSEGSFWWRDAGLDPALCRPAVMPQPWKPESAEWAVNEALTCLWVGLHRWMRGEWLTAHHFVQRYAVDLLLATASTWYTPQIPPDAFQHERRLEQRFPALAAWLPKMVQGYARTPESAEAVLSCIRAHHAVDVFLGGQIDEMIGRAKDASRP